MHKYLAKLFFAEFIKFLHLKHCKNIIMNNVKIINEHEINKNAFAVLFISPNGVLININMKNNISNIFKPSKRNSKIFGLRFEIQIDEQIKQHIYFKLLIK